MEETKQKEMETAEENINWDDPAGMRDSVMQIIKAQLPPIRHEETVQQEGYIPMPDGVRLHYTLFMPAGEGSWPVILMRNSYVCAHYALREPTCPTHTMLENLLNPLIRF